MCVGPRAPFTERQVLSTPAAVDFKLGNKDINSGGFSSLN